MTDTEDWNKKDWLAFVEAGHKVGYHAILIYAPPPDEDIVAITFSNDQAYLDAVASYIETRGHPWRRLTGALLLWAAASITLVWTLQWLF